MNIDTAITNFIILPLPNQGWIQKKYKEEAGSNGLYHRTYL